MKKIFFSLGLAAMIIGNAFAQTPMPSFKITNKFGTGLLATSFSDESMKGGLYDLNSRNNLGRWDLILQSTYGNSGIKIRIRTQGVDKLALPQDDNPLTPEDMTITFPRLQSGFFYTDLYLGQLTIGLIDNPTWETQNDNRGWSFYSSDTLSARPGAVLEIKPLSGVNVGFGVTTPMGQLRPIMDDRSPDGDNHSFVAGLSYTSTFGVRVAGSAKWSTPGVDAYGGVSYTDSAIAIGIAGYSNLLNDFAKGNTEISGKVSFKGKSMSLPLTADVFGYYHMFGSDIVGKDSNNQDVKGPTSLKTGLTVSFPVPLGGHVVAPFGGVYYSTNKYLSTALGGSVDTFPTTIADLKATEDTSAITGSLGAKLMHADAHTITVLYAPSYVLSGTARTGHKSGSFHNSIALNWVGTF